MVQPKRSLGILITMTSKCNYTQNLIPGRALFQRLSGNHLNTPELVPFPQSVIHIGLDTPTFLDVTPPPPLVGNPQVSFGRKDPIFFDND